jgi:hypothetical protein
VTSASSTDNEDSSPNPISLREYTTAKGGGAELSRPAPVGVYLASPPRSGSMQKVTMQSHGVGA